MKRSLLILPLTLLLSTPAFADPKLDAEAASEFASSVGAELALKPTGSKVREERYLYPKHRALRARFDRLTVSRVWLASHAEAMSFANARRIELTTDGKRATLFNVLEVRGEQVLVASGARLQDPAFLHRMRDAAWRALNGPPLPATRTPVDVGVEYVPAKPGLTLYRVRISRPADQYLLELPAVGDAASVPGLPAGSLTVEPLIGASPAKLSWGAARTVEVSADTPIVAIGGRYQFTTHRDSTLPTPRGQRGLVGTLREDPRGRAAR